MSIANSNTSVIWEAQGLVPLTSLIAKFETLESILLHPTFLNDLYYYSSSLIDFLAQPSIICELVTYLRVPTHSSKFNYSERCAVAFCAYSVLSCGHAKIITAVLDCDHVLEKLFEFVIPNDRINETSEGYLAGIVKSLLEEGNLSRSEVLIHIQKRLWMYIPHFFTNFSRSMSEVLKLILMVRDPHFKSFQQTILQKLLNAYFSDHLSCPSELAEECSENLIAILRALIASDLAFDFKIQVSRMLYSEKNIANRAVLEKSYQVRVLLLVYLAKIKRIKTCDQPLKFLQSYSTFKSSPRLIFLISDLLEFFRLISENEAFCRNVESGLMSELLKTIVAFPQLDALHVQVLKIIPHLLKDSGRSIEYSNIIWTFLDSQFSQFFDEKMQLNIQKIQCKSEQKVSLHVFFKLISFVSENACIESCRYSSDQITLIQNTLANRFARFNTDQIPAKTLNSYKNSEVLIQNDFLFQGSYAKNYAIHGAPEAQKLSFGNYQAVFLSQNSQLAGLSSSSIMLSFLGKDSNLTSSLLQTLSIDKMGRERVQKSPNKNSGLLLDESEVRVFHGRDSIEKKELFRDDLLSPLKISNSFNLVMKQVEENDSFGEITNRNNRIVKYLEVDMTGSIDPFFGNRDLAN